MALGAAALLLAACTTTTTRLDVPSGLAQPRPARTGGFYAGVLPLGSVPYDNRSLPLVSPDGKFLATQAGRPPAWETLLATSAAPAPALTRVEVYRLDRDRAETVLQHSTESALLLGRTADERGFLVESVEADGSRRIGYATWSPAPVQWLVDDDRVNAFACMGAGDRLSWSRKAPGGAHFDLVVRRGAAEWTLGAQGGDWLMPAWSGRGDGLYALRLQDGALDAAYMVAESPQTTRETLVRLPLGTGFSRHDAYQCLAGQPVTPPGSGLDEEHLLFWHPGADRVALWRPIASPAGAVLLEPGSTAAVVTGTGSILTATDKALGLADPGDPDDRRTLLTGARVPRPVADPDWPYVILSPAGDRIDVMALRLLR